MMFIGMEKASTIEKLNFIGIITIFVLISFFAPCLDKYYLPLFLPVLLLTLIVLNKNFYKFIFAKTEIPFWIFLLTILSGMVNAKEIALAYWHFWRFIFPVPFLYFFAKIGFQNKYRALMIRGICYMALLVSIFGIAEFITRKPFIYNYFPNNSYCRFFIGLRMMSTHIHPAPLGTYFVAVLPLSIGLISREKPVFLKSLAIISSAAIFSGIILTFSRGALLGLFLGPLVLINILFKQKRTLFIWITILSAFVIIALSAFLFSQGYSAFYRYSLKGLLQPEFYSNKLSRIMMTLNLLKEHPFFGVGFGHYRVLFGRYLPDLAGMSSHNSEVADCMYLTLLAETGIIGFSGLLLFIRSLLKRAQEKLKSLSDKTDRLYLVCFLSGLLAMLCTFLTYDGLYWLAPSYLFWVYSGILSFLSSKA